MYARITGFLLAFALAFTGFAAAQERFGNIQGKVLDSSGAVLPGVTITVTNNETKRSTEYVTGADGTYYAQALEPGRYSVKFQFPGFTPKENPDVPVALGGTATVNSTLEVGALTESVQVVAQTGLIDAQSSTQHKNIPAEEFDTLPKSEER